MQRSGLIHRRAQDEARIRDRRRAVQKTDFDIENRLRKAEMLRGQKRFRDAADIYQAILKAKPEHAETLYQLGVMANMTGQHALAADVISRAVRAAGSAGVRYLPELAPALALSGRHEEALAAFRRVTDARPSDAAAHYNMGNLLNSMGKPEEAAKAFRRAAALSPDFVEAHANLGATLHLAKRYEEAIVAYRRALEKLPGNADLHHNLGAVYRAIGRHDAAANCYREALRLAPHRLEFEERLAATLQDLGDYEAAVEAYQRVLIHAPASVDVNKGLAETLIGAGRPEEAVTLCDDFLARRGYNSAILCCKAIALGERGEEAAARRIMDLDRFIRPCRIEPPTGFRSLAAFNAEIEREIRAHESLDFEPAGLATSMGFQTGKLLEHPSYAIGLLALMINGAVRGYIDCLPDDPNHPFVANAPARWTLNGWGVILKAQGHQRPHIHPSGWLSGVYYVRVPASIVAGSQQGLIEFGKPPANIGCRHAHHTRRVTPEAGRMLLFPSYVYHHTIPFEDSENRISFAFDVVPVKG
jgi:tetratricopeptide (TPR) repeat protein